MRTITFSLSDDDQDIASWLSTQANRSAAIRDVLRLHIQKGEIDRSIQRQLDRIERKLEGITIIPTSKTACSNAEEPPAAAAALDALSRL